MVTFVECGTGDDEEGECEDGSDDSAEAVCPPPLFIFNWQVSEQIHIFREH